MRELLVVAHTYQPPRDFSKVFNSNPDNNRVSVFPEVNEKIYNECYRSLFVDPSISESKQFPQGLIVSLFGVLREWWKGSHPKEFARAKRRINNLEDKEYYILGDPYLHPIMPLESEEDQDLLIKMGKGAFVEDLGFEPKGFWLPETAVSQTTLNCLHQNGYEFVVLRSDQLEHVSNNPMFVPIFGRERLAGQMAVVHCDPGLSGSVSFNEHSTDHVESFLRGITGQPSIAWMSDTELYGHHRKFADQFLLYLLQPQVLNRARFKTLDVKRAVHSPVMKFTNVKDNSSWSCSHELGRWKGGDSCCNESEGEALYKRYLYETLNKQKQELDTRLDVISPAWRKDFITFFLRVRRSMYFQGSVALDIQNLKDDGLSILEKPGVVDLFLAETAYFTGKTSCAWFFEGERPERVIAHSNIDQIKKLLSSKDAVVSLRYG